MADSVEVKFSKSREEVALELMRYIALAEGHKVLHVNGLPKDYAFKLYYETLRVVMGYEPGK